MRPRARLRDESRVKPLELFFDLVFVLALTQCTALMADHPTWEGLAQGMLVLGMVWWAWVGYAWLTSVVDPEEGAVRLAIFGAMAAMLIVALSVPEAFDELGLVFALALGVVRSGQIALFVIADPDDAELRRSVAGLATSTAVAVSLLAAASFFDGAAQGSLWALALFLDIAGPYFIRPEGWRLEPEHFAERHGLIVIIALGESIVAIGIGAAGVLTLGIGTAAVLGVALTAAMWWVYFDVVALISAKRLAASEPGRERNELARDSYSILHLLIVAGIVLGALGLKETIGHHDEELGSIHAFALLGGVAIYLIGLISFRYRHVHTISHRRLVTAVILLMLVPVAMELPALAALALVNVLIWTMIAVDTRSYGERRHQLRHPEPAEADA
jgi:low temperature requirement protein LtrA